MKEMYIYPIAVHIACSIAMHMYVGPLHTKLHGCVTISMLAPTVVYHGFETRSGQTKECAIGNFLLLHEK